MYGGSGSTLIGAEKLQRKCYGIELDPKFCDAIVRRYIAFVGVKNIDIGLNYDKKSWNVKKFTFESPEAFLDLSGNVNVDSQKLNLKFNLKLGTEKLKIKALGKLPNPKVKPEMSGTINSYLMTSFKNLQNLLDKHYSNQE